jgi:hypothetical protein
MKIIRVALFASVLFALAACNLLSVPIDDPFGLDGESITAIVQGSGSDGIVTQVASTAVGSANASVNDSSDATGTLTNIVTFEADVTVTKAAGNTNAYPPTITVENANVAVSIDDGTADAVNDNADFSQSFSMTRDGACASTAAPCDYTMEVPAGVSISLAIGTVLNNDQSPNAVAATLTLSLDSNPGLEGGDQIQFFLDAAEGSGGL